MKSNVENSEYVVVLATFGPYSQVMWLGACAKCRMAFNTGRSAILADNSFYVDRRATYVAKLKTNWDQGFQIYAKYLPLRIGHVVRRTWVAANTQKSAPRRVAPKSWQRRHRWQ